MAETKQIPRHELARYFDEFSRRFARVSSPEAIDIELISPELGDQIVANGARLAGITYDPHDNALDFMFELTLDETADHRILAPLEVWVVEEGDGFVSAMEIVHADGLREVANIRKVGLRRVD